MTKFLASFFTLFLSLSISCSLPALALDATPANESFSLVRITPAGLDVEELKQIVFEFNRSVVPLGRMERNASEVPIEISPMVDCQWRWLNTSTLACQLGEKAALVPATKYTIKVLPQLHAFDGTRLGQEVNHSFTTLRPAVSDNWFKKWISPTWPQFYVGFNQEVTGDSIRAHLYFETEDGKRFPVKALRKKKSNLRWRIEPLEELPPDSAIALKVEPGLQPVSGTEPSAEAKTVLTFFTFPEFRFAGVRCWDLNEKLIELPAVAALPEEKRCDPLRSISLLFTSPVLKEAAREAVRIAPDPTLGQKDVDPWESVYSYTSLRYARNERSLYDLNLPFGLKAFTAYSVSADPSNLKDEFGRSLSGELQAQFMTDHRRPKIHLEHELSMLETEADTHLPVVVTNLQAVEMNYSAFSPRGNNLKQKKRWDVYEAKEIAYPFPLKLRELIKGKSGLISGSLSAIPQLPNMTPIISGSNWFFSQVTPFQVHVKLGHFNSLAWVTRLASGEPVAKAKVTIEIDTLKDFDNDPVVKASALTDQDGLAYLPGTAEIDPDLTYVREWRSDRSMLAVRVEKENEIALVPLVHDVEAYPDDVYPSSQPRYGHMRAWGTTAQGVYRLGDTIQYKFYVRNQDNRKLVQPPLTGYRLKVIDPMDKVVAEVNNLTLSEFGEYHGELTIAQTGAVGWYQFALSSYFTKETWQPLRVLVSDFTPAPFHVDAELNGELFHAGESVEVDSRATLHAGGPYTAAAIRVTANLTPGVLRPKHSLAKNFVFSSPSEESSTQLYQTEGQLNDKGAYATEFRPNHDRIAYGTLNIESAVRDDRGKYVSATTSARYVGRDRFVGLRNNDWILNSGQASQIDVLAVNDKEEPVSSDNIKLRIEREETKAARVKGAGNAYLTNYVTEWQEVSNTTLKTKASPGEPEKSFIASYSFTPPAPGYYRFIAEIQDNKGSLHSTTLYRWGAGKGETFWHSQDENLLRIIADQEEYKLGDLARFFIQNPWPGARALITVERFGVQQHFERVFNQSSEIFELPITEDLIPSVYLSVVLTSPRVDKPIDENQVDLGKPSYRMGYVKVPVVDKAKQLTVTVKPAAELYRPRDTISVELQGHAADGTVPVIEYAVTVIDQAVFDLLSAGRDYFDPYKGLYLPEWPDVRNYNLIRLLIGRQKFEKKGANPGGDGGGDIDLRSLFKFVSYWNPSLLADQQGKASFSFQAPDNLTAWRIFVLAATKEDRFGLSDATVRVNRPIEVRSILPNQITEADTVQAGFTVMNRTENPRRLDVLLEASGAVEKSEMLNTSITAEPFKRRTFRLPVKAKGIGEITFRAEARDSQDKDGILVSLPVRRQQALEAVAVYGSSVDPRIETPLEIPAAIRTDVGRISVVTAPSVIGRLEGVFEYMRDYPYACWEQKISKAVMAAEYLKLRPYVVKGFAWTDAGDLPGKTLEQASVYQAPNGGMTYYIGSNEYVCPYLSAYTALTFNWLRELGYAIPAQVESKLQDYLLDLLRHDVYPKFYSKGMASSVRAVALAALAKAGKLTPVDIARYQEHFPEMNLFGKAHFLMALNEIQGMTGSKNSAYQSILGYSNQTSGKLVFSESLDTSYQRILDSPLRANCAVLSSLVAAQGQPSSSKTESSLPEALARAVMQSMKRKDRWENTQENIFCLKSLIDYSQVYEKEHPDLRVAIQVGQEKLGQTHFNNLTNEAIEFDRVLTPEDPGRKTDVNIDRSGTGRLYYSTRLFYSPRELKRTPINSGMEIRREYSVERGGKWELLNSPLRIKPGELVKVDLFVSLPAARNFVVVDDAIPGGLEPVNRDLATSSQVDADKAAFSQAGGSYWFEHDDWISFAASEWSFYHKELRHDAARYYSEYLPPGNYHLSYAAQAISPGEFLALPPHVEEMYDPDVYGQGVPERLIVEE